MRSACWERHRDVFLQFGGHPVRPRPAGSGPMTSPLGGLLAAPPAIVAAGVDVFSDALRAQGADVRDIDWRPPIFGDPAHLSALALDPRRAVANRVAVERVLAAGSVLVDVRPAHEVLELSDRMLLHAGPPIEWADASGPLRGALIGACLFEGWADSVEEAERMLAAGEVALDPCHHHRTVGPMAGVTSPSMFLWCLEDPVHGGKAFCNLNEGLGKVLRMGAYSTEVLDRLAWMRDGPGRGAAGGPHPPGGPRPAGVVARRPGAAAAGARPKASGGARRPDRHQGA